MEILRGRSPSIAPTIASMLEGGAWTTSPRYPMYEACTPRRSAASTMKPKLAEYCARMAVNAALGGLVRRLEDPRLIRGEGRYTDDVRIDGCLHAVFVRSPLAHARITGVDTTAATALPGVVRVFTAADLHFESETAPPRLCSDEVKFVGDAVAVAVAETREAAADAAAAVAVDYDPLPVLVDMTAALDPSAPLVRADKGDNIAFEFDLGEEEAIGEGTVIVSTRMLNQRLAPVPMECSAVVAQPDGAGGITVWTSTQVPFNVRASLAESLGLEESRVRVISPDVGGAFGAKLMVYPEQAVIAAAAMALGRPVRWAEQRTENMTAMTHGRGLVID